MLIMPRVSWVRPRTDKESTHITSVQITFNFAVDEMKDMHAVYTLLREYLVDADRDAIRSVIGRRSSNRIHFVTANGSEYPYQHLWLGMPLNFSDPDVRKIANLKVVTDIASETLNLNPFQIKWHRVRDSHSKKMKPTIKISSAQPIQALEGSAKAHRVPMKWKGISRKGVMFTLMRLHRQWDMLGDSFRTNNEPRLNKLEAELARIQDDPNLKNVPEEKDDDDDDVAMTTTGLSRGFAVQPEINGKGSSSK